MIRPEDVRPSTPPCVELPAWPPRHRPAGAREAWYPVARPSPLPVVPRKGGA